MGHNLVTPHVDCGYSLPSSVYPLNRRQSRNPKCTETCTQRLNLVPPIPKALLEVLFVPRIRDKVQAPDDGGLTSYFSTSLPLAPGPGLLDLPALFLILPGPGLSWGWAELVGNSPAHKAPPRPGEKDVPHPHDVP